MKRRSKRKKNDSEEDSEQEMTQKEKIVNDSEEETIQQTLPATQLPRSCANSPTNQDYKLSPLGTQISPKAVLQTAKDPDKSDT